MPILGSNAANVVLIEQGRSLYLSYFIISEFTYLRHIDPVPYPPMRKMFVQGFIAAYSGQGYGSQYAKHMIRQKAQEYIET